MSLNRQEFTNAGRSMLGRANAGEHLVIPHVVIGSGRAANSAALWPLTELLEYQLTVPIAAQVDQGDGVMLLDVAFNSSAAASRFDLCEVGVMAHIGDEPDRLYSVANALQTGVDVVDPDVQSIHAFKIKVVIDRAPDVTIIIGESRDILAENIGAPATGAGPFKEKILNTLRFKRFIGDGIDIADTDNGDTITFTARNRVSENLDLYVNPSHSNVFPYFSSIINGLAYLRTFDIPAEFFVTVHVDGGRYNHNGPCIIDHPGSSQIKIIGEIDAERTINSVAQLGTPGNYWQVRVTIAAASGGSTGLVVGDWVRVAIINFTGAGGAYENELEGVFRIANIAGANTVDIEVPDAWGDPGFGTRNCAAGSTLTRLPVVIRPGAIVDTNLRYEGNDGFVIKGTGLAEMRNLVIDSEAWDKSYTGLPGKVIPFHRGVVILTSHHVFLSTVAAEGFAGFNSSGFSNTGHGDTDLLTCYANKGEIGFFVGARGSIMNCDSCIATYTNGPAFRSENGGFGLYACLAAFTWNVGFMLNNDATLWLEDQNLAHYNRLHGMQIGGRSFAVLSAGPPQVWLERGNGTPDLSIGLSSVFNRVGTRVNIRAGANGTNVPRTAGGNNSLTSNSLLSTDGSILSPAQGAATQEEEPEIAPTMKGNLTEEEAKVFQEMRELRMNKTEMIKWPNRGF